MANKRRDKGEGTIYQRKDGTWIAQIQNGKKADGKPNVKSLYGKTEAIVKKKLKEYKYELIKNGYVEIKKNTVKEYMDNWLYNIQVNELKPSSFDRIESTLKNKVYKFVGDLQINNISSNDVQNMINKLVTVGFSYSTIKKAYDAINSCFKLGIVKGEIIKNPCLGVSLPKNIKKESGDINFFTDEQITKICNECVRKYKSGREVYRLGQAIIVLLFTGMRIGECLAISWKDIDFDKKMIGIRNSVILVKNRDNSNLENAKKNILKHQNSTKTSAGIRIIYLNKKAIKALTELHELNSKFEYVMCNSNGKIINPRNFDRMFRDILKKCDIDPCGVHSLRHTFASMLFKKGVDVKTVSELLGHNDVSTTYNTYIHIIKEQKQQAVTMLDDL